MSRRGRLQNIAQGLLGTFVSRNNDIDGYWGLGILRLYAKKNASATLKIDLLEKSDHLFSDSPVHVAKINYQKWLNKTLSKLRIEITQIHEAEIDIRFATFEEFPKVIRNTRGEPYVCSVKLGSGETSVVASKTGVCEIHDPTKDLQRVSDSISRYRI